MDEANEHLVTLNLHSIVPRSRANGPGIRTVIWFQGCSLGCPGCFNSPTHSSLPAVLISPNTLIERLAADDSHVDGVTISGGEPLQQVDGLLRLLLGIRKATKLSVILFSGFTRGEIGKMPSGLQILSQLDVLIAGRFVQARRVGSGLVGSANQETHFLTSRYCREQLENISPGEVLIDAAGTVVISGISPIRLISK